jgi:hypothetical protein
MKWFTKELREWPDYWLTVVLLAVAIVGAMCMAGCGNDPYTRPWRDDPTSIQDEHWMDRYVWMTEEEGIKKRKSEGANPPTSWWDWATR